MAIQLMASWFPYKLSIYEDEDGNRFSLDDIGKEESNISLFASKFCSFLNQIWLREHILYKSGNQNV